MQSVTERKGDEEQRDSVYGNSSLLSGEVTWVKRIMI